MSSIKDPLFVHEAIQSPYVAPVMPVFMSGKQKKLIKIAAQEQKKQTRLLWRQLCPCGSGLKFKYCCFKSQ